MPPERLLYPVEIDQEPIGSQSPLAYLVIGIVRPPMVERSSMHAEKPSRRPKELKGDALKAWHAKHQWSPNQLRHTFATKIRKSHGLEAASVLLGHNGLVITETYAEQDQTKAIEVISRVGYLMPHRHQSIAFIIESQATERTQSTKQYRI
jgi:hypothetical protein